jgi:hypothetical protein
MALTAEDQQLRAHFFKVFQVGRVESDVYIVGRAESGWAGLKTKTVQT